MKTLKQILELYKPKSQDEDKFVKKHIVVKHRDKNGNGDDVFQATNIKSVDRKAERHGYEPGQDEEVYEEYEDLDETSYQKMIKAYAKAKSFAHGGPAFYGDETEKSPEDFEKQAARIKSKIPTHMHKDAENAARIEIRGLRPGHVGGYDRLEVKKNFYGKPENTKIMKGGPRKGMLSKQAMDARVGSMPTYAKSHKKANLPEEIERLDEIGDTQKGQELLARVAQRAKERKELHKAQSLKVPEGSPEEAEHIKKQDKQHEVEQSAKARMNPKTRSQMGMRKIGEETEHLEEKLKVSDGIGAWISDFIHSKNPKFDGFSKRKRMKMAQAAFYSAQRSE